MDAIAIAPEKTITSLPLGTHGLRFDSYETAFAAVDPMFRDSITIKNDGVLEVI